MRYWWANQKQQYEQEVAGGCLWCPQRRADGSRNPFYENVRLAAPGDIIFGYYEAAVRAIGIVLSRAREAPSPCAGHAAKDTEDADMAGWLLDVSWLELKRPLAPARFAAILSPLLPEAHAPLTPEGRGIQGGRLLELSDRLARALLQLAGGTDPARLLNPDWQPHQLRFSFVDGAVEAGEGEAPPASIDVAVADGLQKRGEP